MAAQVKVTESTNKVIISAEGLVTVPPASINSSQLANDSVTTSHIVDGTIVNADINAGAAIAATKISGTSVVSSTFDAKGDLLAGTADNTHSKLTVGANGTALFADSAQATGLRWATLANETLSLSPLTDSSTVGPELGSGVGLTQALTGLTIGAVYLISPVSGTLTALTVDGVSQPPYNNYCGFKATATSHTFVGTAGTATNLSVKLVTANAVKLTLGGITYRSTSTTLGLGTSSGRYVYSTLGSTYNTSFGHYSHQFLTTGYFNAAFGYNAQSSIVSGPYNSAFGTNSQAALISGASNNSFGSYSLYFLTVGEGNSAFGSGALQNTIIGNRSSAFGMYSLYNTTGSYNTGMGVSSGYAFTTGSYNTAIGSFSGWTGTTATISGSVIVGVDSTGTGAAATADNEFVLGTTNHTIITKGGRRRNLVTKSGNYPATIKDHVIVATAACVITLPTAVGFTGQEFIIKTTSIGVSLATTSSQTIDGQITLALQKYDSVAVVSDGSNWVII